MRYRTRPRRGGRVAEGAPLLRVYRETYRGFESLPLRQPNFEIGYQERWPSGLRRTLGKRVYRKVPWVRIPLSPPFSPRVRRLPARTRAQPEKSPRFRGVLAVEPSLGSQLARFEAEVVLSSLLRRFPDFQGPSAAIERHRSMLLRGPGWAGPSPIAASLGRPASLATGSAC